MGPNWYAACASIRNALHADDTDYTAAGMTWFRWFALSFVVACGGARPPIAAPPPTTHVGPTGLRVMTLPRPTPNVVRLSLWIDAGTRDASPPQLATLSAWVAARAGGVDVNTRVLPDGTEFWIECDSADVHAAIVQLAHALAARATDSEELTSLRDRLATERARHQVDARHVAERSALVAALGDDLANQLLPFGTANDDADVTPARVAQFLADHFGPNRALLVAVGDIHRDVLDEAIGTHLSAVAAAASTRADRTLPLNAAAASARVERATNGWAATAIAGTGHDTVADAVSAVARQWSTRSVDARWLPVRGGTIALLVAATDDPVRVVHEAISLLSEDRAAHTVPPERVDEDMAALSDRAGSGFCAGTSGDALADTSTRIGYGIALADEARAGPDDEARADQRVRAAQQVLLAAIERAGRAATFRGSVGADAAHVVLENGARITVQRRATQNVGIAIRFLGGASEEHRTSHGRTAVLALLSAQACEGLGAGALITRLNAIGATLTPTLDADSFGLRLSAPAMYWRASLDLLTRCTLRPLLHRRVLRDAQARMLATLTDESAHANAALVAERLATTHPGTIAPWGGHGSALLDLDAVTRAHAQTAVGARVAIAIVGDVPVDAVVATAARRLSSMPAGVLPLTPEVDHAPPDVGALAIGSDSPAAVVMFRVAGRGVDQDVARGFVAALAEELSHTPSVTVTWLNAGAWSLGAWAALGVELPIDTLEQLHVTVDHARQALANPEGRARATALMQHAARQTARMLSEPMREADSRARRLVEGESSVSAPDRAGAALEKFLTSEAHYLVWRGRPPEAPAQTGTSRP